jgi:hypothetical protein
MRAFHRPVDVIGDFGEECRSVAILQGLEQAAHFVRRNSHRFFLGRQ